VLTVAIVLVINLCCTDKGDPIRIKDSHDFGIYFLEDSTLKIGDILSKDLSEFRARATPWISVEDIDFYDWSSHCIYLKQDKSQFFPSFQYSYRFPPSWTDKPYIIAAEEIPCYAGYFLTESSVSLNPAPYIGAVEVGAFPQDLVTSQRPFLFRSDPRENALVREVLTRGGLYHAGLDVFLDTTQLAIKILGGDTTTIEYTVHIKNIDRDDLYVFDPDRMSSEVFHYYSNGPEFLNQASYEIFSSQYKKTEQPSSWDRSWYTLLRSGQSLVRTIRLRGYPSIPPGTYLAQWHYDTPRPERSVRKDGLGRFWIGPTRTDPILLTFYP
jgi:hypothetical protein